jgi:hypothetical protein
VTSGHRRLSWRYQANARFHPLLCSKCALAICLQNEDLAHSLSWEDLEQIHRGLEHLMFL